MLIQNLGDKFELPSSPAETPARPDKVLVNCDARHTVSDGKQTYYQLGVGQFLHVIGWTQATTSNATRVCSKHMQKANVTHIDAMKWIM